MTAHVKSPPSGHERADLLQTFTGLREIITRFRRLSNLFLESQGLDEDQLKRYCRHNDLLL
jgi:hypothetical protein